jgi:hypothetical protein
MVTDVMTDIRRWGTKYPVTRYRVEKVKNEKKANNDKKEQKDALGNRIYIA